METDPQGKNQHEPGAKLDDGKVQPSLVLDDMARAIWAVSWIGTYGAGKYSPNGWSIVPNGMHRYTNAGYRHALKQSMGEQLDPDTEMVHLAHKAWNALAVLDLYLREHPECIKYTVPPFPKH